MATTGRKFWAGVTLLCFILPLCRADYLKCNVARDGDRVIYRVYPDIEDMTLYVFSWATPLTVLATNASPNNTEHGIMSTSDTLSVLECSENVSLTKQYKLKDGTLQDFTANCSFSCSEADTSNQVQDGTSKIGIGGGVGLLLVGLLLVGLIFLYKFRDKVFRKCCCSQTGGLFTSVKVIHDVPRDESTVVHMPVSGES